MIYKSGDYKNGYIFASSSTDADLQKIFETYDEVKCVICNSNTAKNFRTVGKSILTINNKLVDGVFFVNYLF